MRILSLAHEIYDRARARRTYALSMPSCMLPLLPALTTAPPRPIIFVDRVDIIRLFQPFALPKGGPSTGDRTRSVPVAGEGDDQYSTTALHLDNMKIYIYRDFL